MNKTSCYTTLSNLQKKQKNKKNLSGNKSQRKKTIQTDYYSTKLNLITYDEGKELLLPHRMTSGYML
jgi:hypothetical protein